MTATEENGFQFDLWFKPWIGLENMAGGVEYQGIGETLLHAHEFREMFDLSPLVVIGIHRLLTAILQDVFSPVIEKDLKQIWELKKMPVDRIAEFHLKYQDRFNLFSKDTPFFQSADVSPTPIKGENIKSIAYLFPDIPSGTESTHYHHGGQSKQVFCPACTASGLVCLPAFSTSGGAGIKPSINGVPPTYVIPCGNNLLESLLFSIVLPKYQPKARSIDEDQVWWKRKPIIPRSSEAISVGYLHSLTFQPRRVRLYPEPIEAVCTRCGDKTSIGISCMIFDMGESRPKEAPPWFDPFAAYKISDTKRPIPIRPVEGKAAWREYGNLFLKKKQTKEASGKGKKVENTLRPSFLDQIAELNEGEMNVIPVRCVGLRTDMKAKVFEWIDSGFEIPGALLRDEDAGYWIYKGLDFARDCASTISSVFRKSFGGSSKEASRYSQLKAEMFNDYWRSLASPFREWVLNASNSTVIDPVYEAWVNTVIREAERSFSSAAATIGDEGKQLRERFSGERLCRIYLLAAKKKELTNE